MNSPLQASDDTFLVVLFVGQPREAPGLWAWRHSRDQEPPLVLTHQLGRLGLEAAACTHPAPPDQPAGHVQL